MKSFASLLLTSLVAFASAQAGAAAETLKPYKEKTLDQWLEQMNNPMAHPDKRREASWAVAHIVEGAEPDHPELLARLQVLQLAIVDAPVNPEAGQGAAKALAHIGPHARETVPALVDLVAITGQYYQPLTLAQEEACKTLVAIGVSDENVWSGLETRIRYRGPNYTETEAVMALGALAPPEVAVPLLTETLDFGENHHVLAAGRALAEIGEAARPALPALLEAVGGREEPGWWRSLLEWAAPGQFDPRKRYFSSGPAAALLVLGERELALEILGDQVTSLEDAFSGRRGTVASLWYARSVGFDAIGPLLIQALDDPSELVRKESLKVLYRLGQAAEPAFDAVVVRIERDPDEFARVAAMQTAWAIAEGESSRLLPLLIACTEDAGYRVRGEAALMIGRLGRMARDARPALQRLENDSDKFVQRRAAWALRRLK